MNDRPRRACVLEVELEQILAFLHVPVRENAKPTAVLICPPFGWVEICSYRGRRSLAEALADAGYPAARFDLPSTSDSAGKPDDPGRLDAWKAALSGTARWLRETSRASRVVAVGIELGGLLACQAAADGAPIDDLILWGVPATGKAVLREQRAQSRLIAGAYPEDERPGTLPPGDLELTGYRVTAETAAALGAVSISECDLPSRRVLLIERDGLGTDDRVREHLTELGADVSIARSHEYGDMMAVPQLGRIPMKTIETIITWLENDPRVAAPDPPAPVKHHPFAESDVMDLVHEGTPIRESPLALQSGSGNIFAVLSQPAGPVQSDVTAVLLNAGMLRHTGPNRTWVEIARRWAARGIPVVRVDHPGIGDSDGERQLPFPDGGLYTAEHVEQTVGILDQLTQLQLPDRFVVGGHCSGAYWGLHAALGDERIIASLMINLYCWYWSDSLVAERDRRASAAALRSGFLKRLRSGRVNADAVRRVVRGYQPRWALGRLRHSVEAAQKPQIERALDNLRDRNTQLLFLFAESEPLYGELQRQGVLSEAERWPNAVFESMPTRDHMFRAFWLQQHVHDQLDRALDRVLGTAAAVPAQRTSS